MAKIYTFIYKHRYIYEYIHIYKHIIELLYDIYTSNKLTNNKNNVKIFEQKYVAK